MSGRFTLLLMYLLNIFSFTYLSYGADIRFSLTNPRVSLHSHVTPYCTADLYALLDDEIRSTRLMYGWQSTLPPAQERWTALLHELFKKLERLTASHSMAPVIKPGRVEIVSYDYGTKHWNILLDLPSGKTLQVKTIPPGPTTASFAMVQYIAQIFQQDLCGVALR